ncbi:hypothetical protein [Iningainema tapete]|uniref:Uncharacterized protein n=1 Tax=Iningainema tapete BLCC-T55 TaxID=2748662 RepID=A0A8J7BVZ6_9CYAN|nr:hypothetical protein [Iningainema tapete]MBD2770852.1 hypothetical protein [Iningainema tapete BLCC-T55]
MNYQKLDAALAMAMNDVENPEERNLTVFIHTKDAKSVQEAEFLTNLGVSGVTNGKDVFTATLSPNAISQLSEQPWVEQLNLSQKLRLVNTR